MQASATASPPSPNGPLGAIQPIDLAGLGCLLGYGVLAWMAGQPGEPPLGGFFAITAWTALLTFGLFAYRRGEPLPVGRLLFWAVAFRVCGLLGGPFFEDDFHRYLWDAYRFAEEGTPYGLPPEAFFADANVPEAFRRVLDQVNYPDVATIYGPVTELAFLLGYWVQPANIAVLQGIFILFDLATILILLRLAPARAVLLYAWCPLVVKEVAFTAHPDVLGVCLLAAAVLLAQRDRLKAAAVCLALSAGAKIFALLLVPFVLVKGRLVHWAIFAAVLALVYLPFALSGGTDLPTQTLFALEWEFNAAAFSLLTVGISNFNARLVAGVLLLGFWAWCYLRQRRSPDAVPRGDWLYGALLLLAPVINPWYLIWVLPFAVIRPSLWAWTASVAVLLSYITGLNLNNLDMHPFEQPVWVRLVEFGLIAAALAWDVLRQRRQPALSAAS